MKTANQHTQDRTVEVTKIKAIAKEMKFEVEF